MSQTLAAAVIVGSAIAYTGYKTGRFTGIQVGRDGVFEEVKVENMSVDYGQGRILVGEVKRLLDPLDTAKNYDKPTWFAKKPKAPYHHPFLDPVTYG